MGADGSAIGDQQLVFLRDAQFSEGRYEYELLQGPYGRYTRAKDKWRTTPADTIANPELGDTDVDAIVS